MLGILKDVREAVARRLQDRLIGDTHPEAPDTESSLTSVDYATQFSDEGDIERLERRCQEYFEVIERIERERDELWRMYRTQVSEHLNAQSLLLKQRARLMVQLARAVKTIDRMRKEAGMEPLKGPVELDLLDDVSQTAERYIQDMVQLCKGATQRLDKAKPKFVSGELEREKIREDDG